MNRTKHRLFYSFFLCLLSAVFLSPLMSSAEKLSSWDDIVAAAKGQTVDWYMWGGSPAVNKYVNDFLANELKRKYDIKLRQVPVKDIAEIVSKLVIEKQAGKNQGGSVDLMWINGENFRTCKSQELLHGPFTENLPNNKYINWSNPTVSHDFGTPVDGMESPWGSAQMVMIYDTKRTPNPPKSIPALLHWIQENPGRFTYPAPPDFTGSVFIRHIFYSHSESTTKWQGEYSNEELSQTAEKTYKTLKEIKPKMWRAGATYPESPVKLNTLFADAEVDLSFSYQQGEASNNIRDGLFPETVKTYVFDEGTIANTHFVAIPYNAADKAAAMVVANYLLSPEAQLKKSSPEVWGDFPAIDTTRLTKEWQGKFSTLPRGKATLSDEELQSHQLPELPSKILIYLEKGWVEKVLKDRK